METSINFRTAKEVPAEVVETDQVTEVKPQEHSISVGDSKVESPVALYQTLEGRPYTADYFDVKGIWDNRDIGMKDEVEAIERYYVKKVQTKEIEDSRKSYDKFIKQMEKAVGISDMTPKAVRISKLSEYVKFMLRVERIDKEK